MWVGVLQAPKRQNANTPKRQSAKSAKAPKAPKHQKRQRAKEPKRQKRQSAKSAKEQTHHASPRGSECCFLAELVNSEQLSLFWTGTAASIPNFPWICTNPYDKWYDPSLRIPESIHN
jgi:hypothetical protein